MKKKIVALVVAAAMMTSSMTALAASSSTASSTASSAASAATATEAPAATTASAPAVAQEAVVPAAASSNGEAAMSGAEQSAMTYRSPAAIQAVAQAYGMSYAEVANNAVSEPAGIAKDNVYAASQGDKIMINGVASTQKVYLRKLTNKSAAYKAASNDLGGGKLVNYFNAYLPVTDGNTVTVNFYMPKITGNENLKVQQFVDGAWVDLTIKELRKNHVVLDLTRSGAIRFVLF